MFGIIYIYIINLLRLTGFRRPGPRRRELGDGVKFYKDNYELDIPPVNHIPDGPWNEDPEVSRGTMGRFW
jgi:hypothetical protein